MFINKKQTEKLCKRSMILWQFSVFRKLYRQTLCIGVDSSNVLCTVIQYIHNVCNTIILEVKQSAKFSSFVLKSVNSKY